MAYMKQRLSIFPTHLGIGVAQDEAHGGEEVTLARSISSDDDIMFWRERVHDGLILVAK